jgi:purine-cytosine permease-like protein
LWLPPCASPHAFKSDVDNYIWCSVIPLSIVGSHRFYGTLLNFLSLVGYWAAAFSSIVLMEHFIFRHNDPASYDLRQWNVPRKLPSGVAALAAGITSFGVVVPCMGQAWYVGPIARTTGDIGFEVAFAASAVLYVLFRALEIRIRPFSSSM